jgi:hypothetical protein
MTLRIDDDVLRELKKRASKEGLTLSELADNSPVGYRPTRP